MNTSISIEKRLITPELASKILTKNEGNRKISDRSMYFLYNQMLSGDWQLTGDTIKISKDGRLLDGQHRLQALIKYGKPLEMFVAEGLEDKVFTVIDTGKNRTAGDVLSMKGYKNANTLAGSVRSILLFNEGFYSGSSTAGRTAKASNTEVLEFVEMHSEIYEVINFTNTIYRQFRPISHSILTMLYWILSEKNQTKCDDFFEKYATGIELTQTSPIRLLRERLLKDSINKSKLPTKDKVALFIFAWNAYVKGSNMQNLILQKNYTFPKPL